MITRRWTSMVAMVILFALILGGLGWQHRTGLELRKQIALRKTDAARRTQLLAEQKKLIEVEVTPEEMERRRADRAAVSALLVEIEAMKRRAEIVSREGRQRGSTESAATTRHSLIGNSVAASQWINAGRATPDAAFETALWAAGGGDIESLASLLTFDEQARGKAEAIFAALPAGIKQELATPERLIALLVAKDAPLGSAQILTQAVTSTGAQLNAQLTDDSGKTRQVRLTLRPEKESWRFVVPPGAVDRYMAQLRTPAANIR